MTPNTQIATDHRRFDRLVEDLYGLTDDQILIIEEATSTKG